MRRSLIIGLVAFLGIAVATTARASNGCGLEGEPCCDDMLVVGGSPRAFEIGANGCAAGLGLECVGEIDAGVCVAVHPAPAVSDLGLGGLAVLLYGAAAWLRSRKS